MIQVNLYQTESGRIQAFEVRGHSGTAEYGEDVICAGVSALAETALLGLLQYLRRDVDYHVESGNLSARLNDAPDIETEAILQTMLLGLLEIEKQAPQAVTITETKE